MAKLPATHTGSGKRVNEQVRQVERLLRVRKVRQAYLLAHARDLSRDAVRDPAALLELTTRIQEEITAQFSHMGEWKKLYKVLIEHRTEVTSRPAVPADE